MSSIPAPSLEQLGDWLSSSVATVFETIYHLYAAPVSSESVQISEENSITVLVGFSGDINVNVRAWISSATAAKLASIFLEMPASELDEPTIGDAMGELGNMVVGGMKSSALDMGIPCEMSIPIVSFDASNRPATPPVQSTLNRAFAFEGGQCLFEVALLPKA